MRSIGIMSMQRIYNYGSSLQAYALKEVVNGMRPDACVSFVDYRPGPPLITTSSDESERATKARRVIAKLREYYSVDAPMRDKLRFMNHKRSYARRYFPLVGIPETINHQYPSDLQIIGSDEVFNCVQSNTNVGYARDLFGHESPARTVVSYAASFGNTTLGKIEAAGIRSEVAGDLNRFDALSVRDLNSQRVVESLTGRRASIHLDPTLVHDFFAAESRVPEVRQRSEPYVIVYGYSGRFTDEENSFVRQYAKRIGAKVLAIGGLQASADEFIDCDPFTLLAYFRDASAVVTDTFHGSIFAAINEVPFATLVRKSVGHRYGNEEKLGFLLDALGLSSRALRASADLPRLLDEPTDFEPMREAVAEGRERAIEYLARVSG